MSGEWQCPAVTRVGIYLRAGRPGGRRSPATQRIYQEAQPPPATTEPSSIFLFTATEAIGQYPVGPPTVTILVDQIHRLIRFGSGCQLRLLSLPPQSLQQCIQPLHQQHLRPQIIPQHLHLQIIQQHPRLQIIPQHLRLLQVWRPQVNCETNPLKIIGFGNEKWRVGMLSPRYTLGFGNRPRTTVKERMLSATMQSRLLNELKNISRVFHAR
mmetsp:Transcript_23861/g.45369  ORF Transcript_23861/g.45369 Transcript_23861/m.45369 type:complete len:212 (-) Transcript_23861:310-945(-)